MSPSRSQSLAKQVKSQALTLGGFVATFWGVEIINLAVFRDHLDTFGIIPRNFIGLRGIVFAPFLHGGFGHLLANTIPFVILGWLTMLQRTSDFWVVTVMTMFVGGMGVWLFAQPNSIHIGSSILIFGYLGFLLTRGYFQRNIPSIALSLLVGFIYGGMIWGVFPSSPSVSWQGHLFGFLGGVLAARLIAKES